MLNAPMRIGSHDDDEADVEPFLRRTRSKVVAINWKIILVVAKEPHNKMIGRVQ